VVARELDEGGPPPEAAGRGAIYFLEVSIAMEVLEDWQAEQRRPTSDRERCERVTYYAINDA
jgi:hypothetical protein